MADFHSTTGSMDKTAICAWLAIQYLPKIFAIPLATREQIVDNAVLYWNTHSGYEVYEMVDAPGAGVVSQLSTGMKTVVAAYPTKSSTWIYNTHPLWTLTGIQILDNITGDLIMMSEAFRNYHIYVGSDFRWYYEASTDDTVGGKLYSQNLPRGSEKICVRGTKRIRAEESIALEDIKQWILRYAWALAMELEGDTLRKAIIADIKTDGDMMIQEAREDKKTLQEQLAAEGRWVALVRRA